MTIAVVGSGFVGQATGKGLSKHGHEVTFVDVDPKKVESLRSCGYQASLASNYPRMTTDITMFCVPTPTRHRVIQLSILEAAVEAFAVRLREHDRYHVAVIRSTVPPGTTRKTLLPLIERVSGKKVDQDFGLVMQPEYLREVTAEQDFARPWYILVGSHDRRAGEIIARLYRNFDAPIERCTLDEAEFQKYVHNVYNAMKIAFFNELRIAAKAEGYDTEKIFHATAESCEGMWNPLYGIRDMGPFDGACLPKDTWALLEWGQSNNHDLAILREVVRANLRHEMILGKNEHVRANYVRQIAV